MVFLHLFIYLLRDNRIYGCKEIAEAISLADTFDIDASSEGEVWLHFGFKNARIPIFLKEREN